MGKKALIAMSGGVDSSVAAWLMKERGYDCIGITAKLFSNADLGLERDSSCCSLDDINDARNVAYRMGMPHYVLNFSDEFRDQVIRRFVETYEAGGTPNPCIDCNRSIKFEGLLRRAKQLDFEILATGHYARIETEGGRYLLKKARDARKDQSYVLYCMTQEQLAHTVFPLGDKTKGEVREIAREQGFVNAKKRDSQDICFVPDGDYAAFIEAYRGRPAEAGDILDGEGRVLGRHRGLIRYTIGQRRGLGLSSGRPLYVAAKETAANTLTVDTGERLYARSLIAGDCNFIAAPAPDGRLRVRVKTRYLQAEAAARAEVIGPGEIRVDFDEPQRAVTPGQAAVLYDGDYVIGGGTILRVLG
ncbi:MAG: tRNA 2-thiouridine(34) synthase MnmA [Spirochaetaceae bacterium]|nr:tRNA 2-thiouridine(34) synthase MnmA [Spirochaetaceae bacterium]